MQFEQKYCLVLSGGGAKGVYHIGVWKALKKLGIQIEAIVGNSVGALITGFLVQGKEQALEEIGDGIDINYILNIPDEFLTNGELKLTHNTLGAFKEFYRSFTKKKGLDTNPMRQVLEHHLNEDAIRRSPIDMGVVAFNISKFKPVEIFVDDMPAGTVLDYLMASSAFPGFESPEIAGDKFIDGGVHDNIPYKMARKRGYTRIIVVDISGVGRRKRPQIEGSNTIYIKNSINIGGTFDFDRSLLNQYKTLGYLDTLRIFGFLQGHRYFLHPNQSAETRFQDFIRNRENPLKLPESGIGSIPDNLRELLPEYMRFERNLLMAFMECTAQILKINRIRSYTYTELDQCIASAVSEIRQQISSSLNSHNENHSGLRGNIEILVKDAIRRRSFSESLYYYVLAIDGTLPSHVGKFLLKTLMDLSPELKPALFTIANRSDISSSIFSGDSS